MNIWKVEMWAGDRALGEVLAPAGTFLAGRPPQRCLFPFPSGLTEISQRSALLDISDTGMVRVVPIGSQVLHVTDRAGVRTRVPDGGLALSDLRSVAFFNGGLPVAELVFHRIPGRRRIPPRSASGTTRELGLGAVPPYVDARGEVTWQLVAVMAVVLHRRHQRGTTTSGLPVAFRPLSSQSLRAAVEAVSGRPVTDRVLTARLSSAHRSFGLEALGTERRRDGKAVPLATHLLDTRWALDEVLDEMERRLAMVEGS